MAKDDDGKVTYHVRMEKSILADLDVWLEEINKDPQRRDPLCKAELVRRLLIWCIDNRPPWCKGRVRAMLIDELGNIMATKYVHKYTKTMLFESADQPDNDAAVGLLQQVHENHEGATIAIFKPLTKPGT